MKIVGIGGGTGLPVVLSGLKELRGAGEPLDITAIVTVADSGGSTGALRNAFNMPAMGDVRKCMIALAPEESVLTSVWRHRFARPGGFAGHSLGNLIISALYEMSGSFASAVAQACETLQLEGRVLPATESLVTLCALYEDGGIARGEVNIPQSGRRIREVWLERHDGEDDIAPSPGVVESLLNADAIVIGPGSLFTSIIPNLLVPAIAAALEESSALKIYVTNLMTQPGETDGYSAGAHVRTVLDYIPLDVCVLNASALGTAVAERYLKNGSRNICLTAKDETDIRKLGVTPMAARLLREGEVKARHDSAALAELIVSVARELTDGREVKCG